MPACYRYLFVPQITQAYESGQDSVTLQFPNTMQILTINNLQTYPTLEECIQACYKTIFVSASNTSRITNAKTGEIYFSPGGKATIGLQNFILCQDFLNYTLSNSQSYSDNHPIVINSKINGNSNLLFKQ